MTERDDCGQGQVEPDDHISVEVDRHLEEVEEEDTSGWDDESKQEIFKILADVPTGILAKAVEKRVMEEGGAL